MRARYPTLFSTLLLVLAACGGGADTSDTEARQDTPAEQSAVEEESDPDVGATPGSVTADDPPGDLVGAFDTSAACESETSFDLAQVTVTASGESFTVEVTGHTGGEIQQIKLVATAPNGEWYDFRARADGNHTADGGGPYAWDRLSEFQLSLEGSGSSYSMSVNGLVIESGWTVEVETRSDCADVAEATLG